MAENVTLIKIRNLIKKAEKFDDMQFRLLLEDLAKEGGREAESLLGEMIFDESLPESVRSNLIRIMGYITSTTFLIPLKKMLETGESMRLRKAAIISIAKFNDKRALNMLNIALKNNSNPILQEAISSEVSRIKKDNPILSLLPKFLNGVNDPKTFRTTLEVLKQILNPTDAQVFIYHLKSDIPFVGDGAFEILCFRGDDSVKFSIFDFFKAKLKRIDCIEDDECYALLHLLQKLEQFIVRNSHTINYILKDLKDLYKQAGDPQIKDVLINMFCSSDKREVLSFMEDVYNTEPGRREMVIEKLKGNEGGAFILIYKYKNDENNKKPLLKALLTSQTGWDYVMEIFDSLLPALRDLVLENVDKSNYPFARQLVERFLMSKEPGQKKFALDKISESSDLGFQSILFDPDLESEFIRMQNEYMGAISQLFFIQSFKFVANRLVKLEQPRPLMRKYLSQEDSFILSEPIIRLADGNSLVPLAETIVNFNNREMNEALLFIFCHLKTFHYPTYQNFQAFLDKFKELRGNRISPEEKGLVNKAKTNFLNISDDLKKIEKGNTNISHFVEKDFPDYELLDYLLKAHHLSFFVNRHKIIERIKKVFKLTNEIDAFDSIKYFIKQPDFCIYFREEIERSANSENYLLKNDSEKLKELSPENPRFVLFFKEISYYSCFGDQLNELMPEYEIIHGEDVRASDILITDTESFKELAADNRLNTDNRYVLLESKEEFADIKDLKPKVFPPPLSFYKIMKAIIDDLFPV